MLQAKNGFSLSLFAKPLLYPAGLIVLLCLLAVAPPASAQTAPTLDANGWTAFTPVSGTGSCSTGSYTGTCIVYVSSSSGNDLTCAAVAATSKIVPCRTLDRATSLLRNKRPDWLLLKRGDTFMPDESGNNFGQWKLSGVSVSEPMVIGSYDPSQPGVVDPYVSGARPLVENAHGTVPLASFGTGSGQGGDYLAIVGLEFYDYTDDPSNANYNSSWTSTDAISLTAYVSWLLIEDCKFSFYNFNVNVEPDNNTNPNASTSVFAFNRNIVMNAYGVGAANSSGMFVGGQSGLASGMASNNLTGNVFDHNGWNATISGAGPTTHNHNLYMECANSIYRPTNSYETFENNIFANDASVSAMRLPGTYTGNLLAYVPNGFAFGATTTVDAGCTMPPTTASATYNVVLDGNYNSAVVGGGGFETLNLTAPANITNNIISTYASTNPYGYALQIATPNADNNFANNTVWDWANNVDDIGGTGDVTSPNNYNCTTCYNGGAYPDPYRSLGSYYATLSGATSSAVVAGTINNCSPSCAGSTTAGNIMNVTGVTSGTLKVGDAITFPGQSYSVVITGNAGVNPILCGASSYCTGNGGTGTYAVNIAVGNCGNGESSCTTAGAIPMRVSSQTLADYSGQSLITAEHSQSKANWNALLAAPAVNAYIQAGFGLSNASGLSHNRHDN